MSESESRPDGRHSDGGATTGFFGARTTDEDEERLELLAEEFGNPTDGFRNALEIACDELGLDTEGER